MWSIYFLVLVAFCLGLAAWLIFLWAAKSGQYDDPEGPKYRMLDDDGPAGPSTKDTLKKPPTRPSPKD